MSIIKISEPSEVFNTRLSDNFKAKELMCNHCNELVIYSEVINGLEKVRALNGNYPMNITSGYRCPVHNANVGGSSRSLHKYGKAVDYDMFNKYHGLTAFTNTTKVFNRVGFYRSRYNLNKSYIHADIGTKKLYWLSFYDTTKNKRVYIYFSKLDNFYAAVNNDTKFGWKDLTI